MREYSPSLLLTDATAGLTVAMAADPHGIAIAMASEADPTKGLLTAVIGGPTGTFIVVVFNVIANHGYDGLVLATGSVARGTLVRAAS